MDHVNFKVEDMLSSGDKVVARFRAIGTQTGEFMGLPATGRSVDVVRVDAPVHPLKGRNVIHSHSFLLG